MFSPDFLVLVATCVALTVGATQALKKVLGWTGAGAVFLSVVISGAVALGQLLSAGSWTVVSFVALWAASFLEANGLYLFGEQLAEKAKS